MLVALPAGLLAVPAGSIARQVLAALVPEEQRRTAYSLDTVSVEVTFMVGPSLGILISTQFSSAAALTSIGVLSGLVAVLLYLMNPPVRADHEVVTGARPPLRSWLSRELVATLLIAAAATFVLVGMELAALASLRENGEVDWTGVVITLMCVASLAGGIVHGAVHKSLSQVTLMVLLAVLTIPVGLVDTPWWLLALVLVPSNLVCAPTLAATTEAVSSLAPARVRGEAMGLQDSATRIGLAMGRPVVGFVIDHSAPGWGFVASGVGGLALASVGILLRVRFGARTAARAPAER